jgi:putative ATP-grasp target RiPP
LEHIMTGGLATFAREPLAPHSAQFPLPAGSHTSAPGETPSEPGTRPWNLRALTVAVSRQPAAIRGTYDPIRQILVTPEGRPHTVETAATANSVSNNDGDEGPSEDWTYDYTPDNPYEV